MPSAQMPTRNVYIDRTTMQPVVNTEDKLLPEKDDTPKQRLEDDGEDWTLGLSLPESTKEERLSSRMKDKTENKPKQIPSRFHLRV